MVLPNFLLCIQYNAIEIVDCKSKKCAVRQITVWRTIYWRLFRKFRVKTSGIKIDWRKYIISINSKPRRVFSVLFSVFFFEESKNKNLANNWIWDALILRGKMNMWHLDVWIESVVRFDYYRLKWVQYALHALSFRNKSMSMKYSNKWSAIVILHRLNGVLSLRLFNSSLWPLEMSLWLQFMHNIFCCCFISVHCRVLAHYEHRLKSAGFVRMYISKTEIL